LPVHCLSVKDALCRNGSLSQRVTTLATPRADAKPSVRKGQLSQFVAAKRCS
jgi:hypothetical protein